MSKNWKRKYIFFVDLFLNFFWQIEDEGLSSESCKDSCKRIYKKAKGIRDFHNDMNCMVIQNLQMQTDQEAWR